MKRYPELIRLIPRLVALGIGHVGVRIAPGRTVAHDLIASPTQAGLLEGREALRGELAAVGGAADGIVLSGLETAVAGRRVDDAGRACW